MRVIAHDIGHIVAGNHRYRQISNTQRLCLTPYRACCAQRIGRAHVSHNAHAIFNAGRQYSLEALDEIRCIAAFRVFQPRQILACDGAFGEAFKHQIVKLSALSEINRRFDAVIRKSRAGADTDGAFVYSHGFLLL